MLEESPAPPAPPPAAHPAAPRVAPSLAALKVLLAINVVMYALEVYLSDGPLKAEVLLGLGANDASRVWAGEYWRLIASAFLHGNLLHLALNMQALFALGSWLEEELGALRLLLLYLGTALTGSAASVAFGSGGLSVGASGAVFGFVGALLALTFLAAGNQRRAMLATRRQLFFVVVLNLGLGFWMNNSGGPMRIDNMAHLGGLVGGLVLGVGLFAGKLRGARSILAVGGLAAFGVLSGVLLALSLQPRSTPGQLLAAAVDAHQKGDVERMRALLLDGARQSGGDPDFHVKRYALCAQVKDDACSLESLQALLNMDPLGPKPAVDEHALTSALTLLGAQAYLGGDVAVGVLAMQRVAQLRPEDADALNNYAWFLLVRGHLTLEEQAEALHIADRARRIANHGLWTRVVGGDLNVEHTYAEALRQSGRTNDALAVLQGMLELHPARRWLAGGGRFTVDAIHEEMERMRAGKPPRDFE